MAKRSAISKQTRYDVLRRSFFSCFWCGLPSPLAVLEIDHLVPVSRGGQDHASNLVAACVDCNAGRSDSIPRQEDLDRAYGLWCSYETGRAAKGLACWVCHIPLDPAWYEDEEEVFDTHECCRCNGIICDAHESGVRWASSK